MYSIFMAFPKSIHSNRASTKTFTSILFYCHPQKLIYHDFVFPIPPSTYTINIWFPHQPAFKLSHTSCSFLLKHSRHTCATTTISYNSLNPSYLLIIPTHYTYPAPALILFPPTETPPDNSLLPCFSSVSLSHPTHLPLVTNIGYSKPHAKVGQSNLLSFLYRYLNTLYGSNTLLKIWVFKSPFHFKVRQHSQQ